MKGYWYLKDCWNFFHSHHIFYNHYYNASPSWSRLDYGSYCQTYWPLCIGRKKFNHFIWCSLLGSYKIKLFSRSCVLLFHLYPLLSKTYLSIRFLVIEMTSQWIENYFNKFVSMLNFLSWLSRKIQVLKFLGQCRKLCLNIAPDQYILSLFNRN